MTAGPDPYAGPEWTGSKGIYSVVGGPSRSGRPKVSRRKKRKLRRRRRIGYVMLGLGALIVLAGLYVVITGLLARSQLTTVRSEVAQLRAQIGKGDLVAARKTASDLASHAHTAHQLTGGPVWALAADIPAGGAPLETIRGVTSAVDELGRDALPQLVKASDRLDPAKLRRADGSIDLAPIVAVAPSLRRADAATQSTTAAVGRLAKHTWLSSIDRARNDVVNQLTSLGHTVRSADLAARIAPAMLGSDGTRRYFLAFQTEAELRGTGGLPGAFAIVVVDHGKLRFSRFENDSTLVGVKTGLDFGNDFNQLYAGANATNDYADSNVSPNFPYAAKTWAAMWRKYSGQRLDGAMALDPTALSYLLGVAGPVRGPDNTQVAAANVVALTQQRVYSKFGLNDQDGRKRYQLQIAKAISNHLLDSKANTTSLVRVAGKAAGQHRLLAWSADPAVQSLLAQTALGGVVPETSARYAGVAINNAAANKLDYYLNASMSHVRTGCGRTGDITVTIVAANMAPAGLPKAVLGSNVGKRGYPQRAGDNRVLISYFATHGAQLSSITVDGKASTSQIGAELGHPVYTVDLPLPRGQTQTIVMHLTEPAGSGDPVVRAQPLVRPLKVTVDDAKCG